MLRPPPTRRSERASRALMVSRFNVNFRGLRFMHFSFRSKHPETGGMITPRHCSIPWFPQARGHPYHGLGIPIEAQVAEEMHAHRASPDVSSTPTKTS